MDKQPRYSGPNRTGICKCGHSWNAHHLGLVMKQEYINETHEGYIPQECEFYGHCEVGGLMYDKHLGEWVPHCYSYIDSGIEMKGI